MREMTFPRPPRFRTALGAVALLALAVAALAAFGVGASASPAAAATAGAQSNLAVKAVRRVGPVVGLGEQKAQMFDARTFVRLGVRDARYTAPWDALDDPAQLALLDQWMANARRDHVRVLLGFAHSLRTQELAHKLPSVKQFTRAFKRFKARYPYVKDWLAWNEANNPGALTAHNVRRAARYFDVVAGNCRGCRVVAADLLDTSNMAPWLAKFKRYVKHRPKIWGLHNYGDTNGFKTRNTTKLLALTKGAIWMTETGGVITRRVYSGGKVLSSHHYSLKHAAQATTHALSLACLSSRVQRVYLYHWQAPYKVTNWDSGLLDSKGRTRPAYTAVKRWLSRAARAARRGGGGRRALCATAR